MAWRGNIRSSKPVLDVKRLDPRYSSHVPVIEPLSFQLGLGDGLLLKGPNGSGKSTALLGLLGNVPHVGGAVCLDGECLKGGPTHRVGRGMLGAVLQREPVFLPLNGMDHLRLAVELGRGAPQSIEDLLSLSLFERVKTPGFLTRPAYTYSGGERRLLAIAAAVLRRPAVLLLDEPTAGLAGELIPAFQELMTMLRRDGVAVIIVEHRARWELPDMIIIDLSRGSVHGDNVEIEGRPPFEM